MEEKKNNEQPKSAFTKRVEEVYAELMELMEAETAKDGMNRGIIILSSEEEKDERHANIVALGGRGKELVNALEDFANQESSKKIFDIVASSRLARKILGE